MKIIYVSHWRFPSEKTMSPLIMKTCEMFAGQGIEVELWVPWRNNQFRGLDAYMHHDIKKNFVIRRIPTLDVTKAIPGTLPFYLMLASFNVALFFFALLNRSAQNAVFYFHDLRDAIPLAVFKRPLFLEIHDFYKSNIARLNKFVFSQISGFVVTNEIKIKKLCEEFSLDPGLMLHQPNGVEVALFSAAPERQESRRLLGLSADKKIILYTGHLFDWKGVDTLFDAHRFLSSGEIIYFVGGTDEDIQKFKMKSEKLKTHNVVVAGRKPHREIPLWLKAADVLVLPNTAKFEASKYETSPVKLFEYMASGTPIIASDLPAIRNIVDETMVFFFQPDDPRALVETIKKVLVGNESTMKAARAVKEVTRYSWENRTKHILSFLENIIKR